MTKINLTSDIPPENFITLEFHSYHRLYPFRQCERIRTLEIVLLYANASTEYAYRIPSIASRDML